MIKRSLRIQYPQARWEDFRANECIEINNLLGAPVVPGNIENQNEPNEENPHVFLVASLTRSQGEHEEPIELDSGMPINKELPSSKKQKAKGQRGCAPTSSTPSTPEENISKRKRDAQGKNKEDALKKKKSIKKGKMKIKA